MEIHAISLITDLLEILLIKGTISKKMHARLALLYLD